jgi:hypothetical protein
MAPPEPSEVMVGYWALEPAMLRRATPLVVHCGAPLALHTDADRASTRARIPATHTVLVVFLLKANPVP